MKSKLDMISVVSKEVEEIEREKGLARVSDDD